MKGEIERRKKPLVLTLGKKKREREEEERKKKRVWSINGSGFWKRGVRKSRHPFLFFRISLGLDGNALTLQEPRTQTQ